MRSEQSAGRKWSSAVGTFLKFAERDSVDPVWLGTRSLEDKIIAVERHLPRSSWMAAYVPVEYRSTKMVVAEMAYAASRTIHVVMEFDPNRSTVSHAILDALLARSNPGVSVRILFTGSDGGHEVAAYRYSRIKRSIQMRKINSRPVEGVLVDGKSALLCADFERESKTLFSDDELVVQTVESVFSCAWQNSEPLVLESWFGDKSKINFARLVLSQMYAGVTDQVAARKLRISLRTYRRVISEIMAALNATSRFQAGTLALELGLLKSPSAE